MVLSRMHSVSLLGLEAVPVEVEVDYTVREKSSAEERSIFVLVGLPDTAVRESKDRVLTALKNSNHSIASMFCTVNLAPGDLKKEGVLYDLPIAMGVIRAMYKIESKVPDDYLMVGEVGLSGDLRPIQGALASAMLAKQMNKKGILLPIQNANEAASLTGIDVIPIRNLKEAFEFLRDPSSILPLTIPSIETLFKPGSSFIDFADIKGQAHVKRAMEICAAGNHNIILSGPPGSGKTMIAKALPGIMPELTVEEALEVTKIHSISGMIPPGVSLITQRPFRSPHHTVSYAGLIGGGSTPRPGEVSLAHNGILFLDELPEFSRSVLEVLRQPLEDRKVTISRAQGNFTFPSDFLCIAAMNPCPCGYLGHPDKPCKDTSLQIDKYKGKISGPLWDRIDMHLEVPALRYRDIMESNGGETSAVVRERVKTARLKQEKRYGKRKTNSQMSSRELKTYCTLDQACQETMREAIDVLGMSARASDRLLRVALTISDLAESPRILQEHLMEAISYRKMN